jgi:hypothetical protein
MVPQYLTYSKGADYGVNPLIMFGTDPKAPCFREVPETIFSTGYLAFKYRVAAAPSNFINDIEQWVDLRAVIRVS